MNKMNQELVDKSKELFESNIKTPEIKAHCLEVSIIMKFLAKELGEDIEKWEMAGLLHDLDYEEVKDLEHHVKKTIEILKQEAYPEDLIHAVASHNEEGSGVKRDNLFDYCLSATDNISGLIYAYALMRKSLDEMKVKGLKKKLKDKTFAAAIRRDLINDVEKVMSMENFLKISIQAMQSIKQEIGF